MRDFLASVALSPDRDSVWLLRICDPVVVVFVESCVDQVLVSLHMSMGRDGLSVSSVVSDGLKRVQGRGRTDDCFLSGFQEPQDTFLCLNASDMNPYGIDFST